MSREDMSECATACTGVNTVLIASCHLLQSDALRCTSSVRSIRVNKMAVSLATGRVLMQTSESPPAPAVQHFTRSKVAQGFKAAGVLPLTLTVPRGEVLVLLGAELVRTGPQGKAYTTMWCVYALA